MYVRRQSKCNLGMSVPIKLHKDIRHKDIKCLIFCFPRFSGLNEKSTVCMHTVWFKYTLFCRFSSVNILHIDWNRYVVWIRDSGTAPKEYIKLLCPKMLWSHPARGNDL